MKIERHTIDSESEADDYLTDLFKDPAYRSMDVVNLHAQARIKDTNIRMYFINRAKKMLKAYGHVVE
jgi:hypothetical protein